MLKVLLKKQMAEIFRKFYRTSKNGKPQNKLLNTVAYGFFMVLLVGILVGVFSMVSWGVGNSLIALGFDWLYFDIMGLIAIFMGCFGSAFNTYASLYLAKDNDMLLSMPIPLRSIIASRLTSVYLMGLIYSSVVMVPAIVVYWCLGTVNAVSVICSILLLLLISLFVLALSCALGWVIAKLSLKLKNKGLLSAIGGLLLFGLYQLLTRYFTNAMQTLTENAKTIGLTIQGSVYPLYLFGKAGTGDLPALLLVAVVVLVIFALACLLLSRSFLKMATMVTSVSTKSVRKTKLEASSVSMALLKKELDHFFNNATYIMNCGEGLILLPLAGLAVLIKGREFVPMLQTAPLFESGLVAAGISCLIAMLAGMNNIAEPSVSMDAKQMWLLKSLPLTPWQMLRAKMEAHWVLTGLPVLFCCICVLVILPVSLLQGVYLLLFPQLFVVFCAALDLFIGLKMPVMDWTNEMTVIKQSAGVFVSLVASFGYVAALGGLYALLMEHITPDAFMVCACLVTLALDVLLILWHRQKGAACFQKLH